MLKVSYVEHKTNVEVFKMANCTRNLKNEINSRKMRYFGHLVRKNDLQRSILEADMKGKRGRGRPRHTWFTNIGKSMGRSYGELAHLAADRRKFRTAMTEMRLDTLHHQ